MKIIANNIRKGTVLNHKNKLWSVTDTKTSQPGKGGSVVTVTMKDIESGNKTSVRYSTQESVESVRIEGIAFQFLFKDGDDYTFMNTETYDQINIGANLIGETALPFLQDGMMVTIHMNEETPIGVDLPETVTMEITEADAVVKGQTASSSYKPAVLENGVNILVPPHITAGTRVVVKTADASYVEKAKD